MNNGSGISREQLGELYRLTMDEYRFQVSLNWQRTQYLLVLNVGILGVGTGLLGVDSSHTATFTGMIFSIGALLAMFSIRVIRIQHSYYRDTRATKIRLEDELEIADLAPRPTRGMKGADKTHWFSFNVTDLTVLILVLLMLVDIAAAVIVFGG